MATTVRTAHPPTAPTAGAIPSLPSFRPDIQGLRAVAVLVVILDHLFGWPAGGFIGVDVFFVISGYLITSLLLREHAKMGRISWVDFYRRRVKRIMPASTLVLVTTVVAAFFIYRTTRFESTRTDAVWGFLFASNWRFATIGTDYWQADGPVSPLRHFWSLAVEEQFYIVWPVLLILILGVVGRQLRIRGRSPQPLLVASMAAVAVASFAWALYETSTDPTFAYFSTFARAWELAVGALVAATASQFARIPVAIRTSVSYVGLAGIAVGLFVIDSTSLFPAPWALLPVLSAAAVIGAGVGGTPRFLGPLTNRPMVFLGKISYSLYLWHFPVIILLGSLLEVGTAYFVWSIVTMLVLSTASFFLVEDPVRRSGWLESRAGRQTHQDSGMVGSGRAGHGQRNLAVVTCVLAIGVAGLSLAVAQDRVLTGQYTSTVGTVTDAGTTADADLQADLTAEIATALSATEWPDLTPAIDNIENTGKPEEDVACGDVDPVTLSTCSYGDPAATKLAVIAGDSVGETWIPMVRALLEPRGYRIQGLTKAGCPFVEANTVSTNAQVTVDCPVHRQQTIDAIERLQPDLLFIVNTYSVKLEGSPTDDVAATTFAKGMRSLVGELAAGARSTVVLSPVPVGKPFSECATALADPADCVSPVSEVWRMFNTASKTYLNGVDGVTYVDTLNWFCSSNQCPSFVGQTPVRRDHVHIVPQYAVKLSPLLGEAIDLEPSEAGARGELSGAITEALSATDWPALDPSIDDVVTDGRTQGCAAPDVSLCEPNQNATGKAMVIGDSVAQRLVWTAREALHDQYNVQLDAHAACAVIDIDVTFVDSATRDACMEYRESVVAAIQATQPDVVFLTQNYAWAQFLTSKASGAAAAAEWNAGLVAFLNEISGSADRVIVVAPGPDGKKLAECAATQSANPQGCVTTLPGYWREIAAAEAEAAGRVGATYWDTSSWYCDAQGRCPAFVGDAVTRFDNVHVTTAFAHELVPVFRDSFET